MVRNLSALLTGCLLAFAVSAHDSAGHTASKKPDFTKMWQEKLEKAPHLAVTASFDQKGRLWLARTVGKHLKVSHSDDQGQHFSPPITVNRNPELIAADGESRPQIAVVGETVYLSWTQGLPQPFAGHIRFSVSNDGGKTFAEPITVNDNLDPITHRFNSMQADQRGVTIAWIDKRDSVGKPDYKGAAIYTARSTDGGKTFAANQKLADHSCECCRIAMATDQDGTPLIFWRHIFGVNERDFALARLGEPLQRTAEDGWKIDACPHHGGSLVVDSQGRKHIAWFTGAEKAPGLHYRNVTHTQMSAPMPFGNLDAQAGHPALAIADNTLYLAWREYDGKENRIMVMHSNDHGQTWSSPHQESGTPGAADDPLLINDHKAAWLIWNTADRGLNVIRLKK